LGDVFRFALPLERAARIRDGTESLLHALDGFLRHAGRGIGRHLGADVARCNAVHANIILSQVDRNTLAEVIDAGLR